jgi:hypothetical protein
MNEVMGKILDIFDEGSLLSNKEIGILSHPLVDHLLVRNFTEDEFFIEQGFIFEVQIDFIKIEEL